ncbi:hypothetical protein LJC01_00525 [Clostridiaceae bacterium OttesenSCG-928-D20]|nr:hypothetical protein [Clostridiaceae bacterium OttesenSCG-928-D20]
MQELDRLRQDCSVRQKKGVHFIISSIVIWLAVMFVHLQDMPILTKNLYTFCCTAPLLPLAYLVSKVMKIDFEGKGNPLTKLGILFSLNQMLYLLIAMWVYPTMPEKMVMVIAIIFGAHLLPYGWLYRSKSYYVVAVIAPFLALGLGLFMKPFVVAAAFALLEMLFTVALLIENRLQSSQREDDAFDRC